MFNSTVTSGEKSQADDTKVSGHVHRVRVLVVAYGAANVRSAYSHRILAMARTLAEFGHPVALLWFTAFYRVSPKDQFTELRKLMPVFVCPTLPIPISGSVIPNRMKFASRLHAGLQVVSDALGYRRCVNVTRRIALRHQAEIIHAETALCGSVALDAGVGARVVTDLHGDIGAELRMSEAPAWLIRRRVQEEIKVIRHADCMTTASNVQRLDILTRSGRPNLPIHVVPCGVDVDRFAAGSTLREATRTRLGVSARHVVCYSGGLHLWQCIDETLDLVEAMRKRNRDIFFLFLTAGDSSRWAKALARIGRQGVDWLALQLSPAQVPEHLAAADIGVLLRRDHPVNAAASPTKLGEYLAAGLPVITTRFAGDAPGILDTSGCGIVLGDVLPTPPELIALDAFVMRHAGDRDTQGYLCRQLAMRSQSWEIASRELKALYERPPLVPHESDPVRPLT